jgi:hypothetical protein
MRCTYHIASTADTIEVHEIHWALSNDTFAVGVIWIDFDDGRNFYGGARIG